MLWGLPWCHPHTACSFCTCRVLMRGLGAGDAAVCGAAHLDAVQQAAGGAPLAEEVPGEHRCPRRAGICLRPGTRPSPRPAPACAHLAHVRLWVLLLVPHCGGCVAVAARRRHGMDWWWALLVCGAHGRDSAVFCRLLFWRLYRSQGAGLIHGALCVPDIGRLAVRPGAVSRWHVQAAALDSVVRYGHVAKMFVKSLRIPCFQNPSHLVPDHCMYGHTRTI
jgi:hypothetical protein